MRRAPRFLSCVLPAAALLAGGSAEARQAGVASGGAAERPNVLLLTLDTTRADTIAPWGPGGIAPNLDRLAAESLVTATARAAVPLTVPSHASIMTGLHPFAHGVRGNDRYRLPADAPTVARLLRDAGYRTEAVIGATVLRAGTGLDAGFERYDEQEMHRSRNRVTDIERKADRVTDAALARLEVDDPRPWFAWVHYFDPHGRYEAPDGPPATAPVRERYDAEVRFMDRHIGRLIDALRASGALERTWIVVAGDHGEGLSLQQETAHAYLCEEGTLLVPLFVRRPDGGLRGRITTATTLADVAPTILAIAGIPFSHEMHGRDLLELHECEQDGELEPRAVWFETWAGWHHFRWAKLEGIVLGRWKYVKNVEPELFDLSAPDGEARNVAAEHPDVVAALARRMEALQSEAVLRLDVETPALSPEEKARLHELGYLSSLPDDETPDGAAVDPRAAFQGLVDLQRSLTLSASGQHAEAIAIMFSLARENPRNSTFLEFLGRVLFQAGRFEEASGAFQNALRIDPERIDAAYYLGWARSNLGDVSGARRWLGTALELSPVHLEARMLLRTLDERAGRLEEALSGSLEILRLAAEMPEDDEDGESLRRDTLVNWLPDLVQRIKAERGAAAAAALAAALGKLPPAGTSPALDSARAILEAAAR